MSHRSKTWTPIAVGFALLGTTVACRPQPAAPVAAESGESETPRLRTTDGQLAAGNFQAELAQAERQWQARPGDVVRARALIEHLLAHAQFFGTLSDYDRARAVAARIAALAPDRAESYLLRARVAAALHQFSSALVDLDEAHRRGGDEDQILHARVGIWQATGQFDRAIEPLRAWRRQRPDLLTYAAEASALADQHQYAKAATTYDQALRHYPDVSPFAVAWIEFQAGHAWESAGRSDRAQPLLESAVARLPIYASATAHLARLVAAFGDPAGMQRAATLLEGVRRQSDDPEYTGQLGALYRQMGRAADGGRLIREATARYETLLRSHPEAFFDHAARFYLHVAGDPARARSLAEKNLVVRPTMDARDLLAEAMRAVPSADTTADSTGGR
ncbi:MAG: hypothetical protein ABUS79_26685 [Pseudomonadota bacterium]